MSQSSPGGRSSGRNLMTVKGAGPGDSDGHQSHLPEVSQLLSSPWCLCLLPSRAQTSVWPPGTTSTARTSIFSELPLAACRSQHWAHRGPTTLINPERVPFPVQPSVTFFQTPKNALGTSPTAEPYGPSPLPRFAIGSRNAFSSVSPHLKPLLELGRAPQQTRAPSLHPADPSASSERGWGARQRMMGS